MRIKPANPLSSTRQSRLLSRQLKKTRVMLTEELVNPFLSPFRTGNVFMFHIGRSGSRVLGEMLRQHQGIYWDGECYYHRLLRSDGMVDPMDRAVDPINFLRKRMLRAGKNFYGLEVKFFHLKMLEIDLDSFIEKLYDLKFSHFIVLERRNYLRKIVSSLIAHETGKYHRSNSQSVVLNQINLNVDNIQIDHEAKPLIDFLQDYHKNFCLLNKLLQPYKTLKLFYEDDISHNPLVGYQRVCNFLGIDDAAVPIPLAKTNPSKLSEVITNFEAVEQVLSKTDFRWMLYE